MSTRPTGAGTPERPALTQDLIISTARRMIRRSGLEGLSIRKLAASLNVSPMAIYGHVESKEDLLAKIADNILSQLRTPASATGTHHDGVLELMSSFYDLLVDYPDLAQMLSVRRVSSPALLKFIDELLTCLHSMGLNHDSVATAYNALMSFTYGAAVLAVSRQSHATGKPVSEQATLRRIEAIRSGVGGLSLVDDFMPELLSLGSRVHLRSGLELLLSSIAGAKPLPTPDSSA